MLSQCPVTSMASERGVCIVTAVETRLSVGCVVADSIALFFSVFNVFMGFIGLKALWANCLDTHIGTDLIQSACMTEVLVKQYNFAWVSLWRLW